MLIYARLLTMFLGVLLVAVPVTRANAQGPDEKALHGMLDTLFGSAQIQQFEKELLRLSEGITGDEAPVMRAARVAKLYMSLVRLARTPREWAIVQAMRPAFNGSIETLAQDGTASAALVAQSAIGKEMPNIFGQFVKLFEDAKAGTGYLLAEDAILAPYGVSSASLVPAFRIENILGHEDLKRIQEQTGKAAEKIKETNPEDMPSRADAVEQIIDGLVLIYADLRHIRRANIKARTLASIAGGS